MKKVLLKILQNSEENHCAVRSLCKFIKKDADTGAFLLIWRNF